MFRDFRKLKRTPVHKSFNCPFSEEFVHFDANHILLAQVPEVIEITLLIDMDSNCSEFLYFFVLFAVRATRITSAKNRRRYVQVNFIKSMFSEKPHARCRKAILQKSNSPFYWQKLGVKTTNSSIYTIGLKRSFQRRANCDYRTIPNIKRSLLK